MKKFVLTFVIVALFASPSFAQENAFAFYSDANGPLGQNSCNITAPIGVPFTIYLFQRAPNGATGSQMKVVAPTSGTFLAIGGQVGNPMFLVIGEPYTDLSLAYTACITGDFKIWDLNFLATAAVPPCQYISVVPAPNKPYSITVDCGFRELESHDGQGIINPDQSCDCNVAVTPSTWGKVKSLYR